MMNNVLFHGSNAMTKMIEKLYMGEINVNEFFDPRTKGSFAKTIKATNELENAFCATLSPEQKSLFYQLMERRVDTTSLEYINMFSEGFRMGARLMLEVMLDDQEGQLDNGKDDRVSF